MEKFLGADFLLETETAKKLYHEHAAGMPIFDYHCHLLPQEIAEDKQYECLGEVWLSGDHYKWRAMRTNGVDEKYCAGNAPWSEKYKKWAETVPYTMRNPLYHWTHLELQRYFDIDTVLSPSTADEIYEACTAKLRTPEYSARNLMRRMNVKLVCTTDDPADSLEYHQQIANDGFEIKVLPTWRPDASMAVENAEEFNAYLEKLGAAANVNISNFNELIRALRSRHDFFHEMGCRLSDHGLDIFTFSETTESEIHHIFNRVREGQAVSPEDVCKFRSAMLLEFGRMDSEKGWTKQLHIGAMRFNATRMGSVLGFDSINDQCFAGPLAQYLDVLDLEGKLPKTILYNLNPRDNEMLATMIGNFQDGSVAGKMQFGSGWWFLDQKDGMERQMNALSNLGLLSRFVGMLTDSRSFLSYPRHEYFRRILCNLIGNDVESGQLPPDMEWLGKMVEDISYNNAVDYFGIELTD